MQGLRFTLDGTGLIYWSSYEVNFWDITALSSSSSPSSNSSTGGPVSNCIFYVAPQGEERILAVTDDGQHVLSTNKNRIWFQDMQTSQKRLMLHCGIGTGMYLNEEHYSSVLKSC